MSLPAQKYSQTKDDKNDQSASEENFLFHEISHSLFCFKRSSLMLSYQQWCLLRPNPPIFLSRLESNFVIKYTPLFYCSVMQILDRKSMFCVTFIEFNSVISYLREYYHFRLSAKIPQETSPSSLRQVKNRIHSLTQGYWMQLSLHTVVNLMLAWFILQWKK